MGQGVVGSVSRDLTPMNHGRVLSGWWKLGCFSAVRSECLVNGCHSSLWTST